MLTCRHPIATTTIAGTTTSTSVVPQTTVISVNAPVATVYAACLDSRNFVSYLNDQSYPINEQDSTFKDDAGGTPGGAAYLVSATSQYDCCNRAFGDVYPPFGPNNPYSGAGAIFAPATGQCYVFTNGDPNANSDPSQVPFCSGADGYNGNKAIGGYPAFGVASVAGSSTYYTVMAGPCGWPTVDQCAYGC